MVAYTSVTFQSHPWFGEVPCTLAAAQGTCKLRVTERSIVGRHLRPRKVGGRDEKTPRMPTVVSELVKSNDRSFVSPHLHLKKELLL